MSKGKLADCLETLGPGHEDKCGKLARRERQMLARLGVNRSNRAVAPGALVVKSEPRLPEGWRASPAGTYKKHVANRRAILWERGGSWQIQLLELGIQYVNSTGRSRFKNSAMAAQMAEEFLSGVGGEFLPLTEGREAARLGGGVLQNPETPESNREGSEFEMIKPSSLRSIVRKSVGIVPPGSRSPQVPAFRGEPQVSGPLRRVAPRGHVTKPAAVAQAVDQALEPIRRSIETLAGQIAERGPNLEPRRSAQSPSFAQLGQMRKSGALRARSAPPQAQPSGGFIARTIPNSSDGLGRPNRGLTVRSAVRRNMGLNYRRPVKVVGRSVRDAITVEAVKHNLSARAKAAEPTPNLVSRTYGNPMTGQRYATPQAAAFWTEANQRPKGVPYQATHK